jgi:hypothetical protein
MITNARTAATGPTEAPRPSFGPTWSYVQDTAIGVGGVHRPAAQPTSGSPVQPDHGVAAQIAADLERKLAPVGQPQSLRMRAHPGRLAGERVADRR